MTPHPWSAHPVAGSSSVALTATASACGDARHWTTREVDRLGIRSSDLRDDVELIVSELVSNAVRHGTMPIVVTLSRGMPDLTVSVADRGAPPYPFGSLPADPSATHGRGLAIVAILATDWGVRADRPGPGKAVWCRLRDTGTEQDRP